ncbi:MAG: homocysteine S-methyltransferase family protein, partial [Promethearchaeota archaeon]
MDGAMGTMLQRSGLIAGELPEIYNFTNPDIITQIHKAYYDAGSDVVVTNTFGANELKLARSGYTVEQVIIQAVRLARNAAKSSQGEKYVALDIGPIGQLLVPSGTLEFDEAYNIIRRQVLAGVKAGVDFVIFETISDLYEAKAGILAVKENSNLPVVCSMTFEANGRTLTGTDPDTMVSVLEGLGVDVLGVNCSLGPFELLPIVEKIASIATVPIIVQPNAGLPVYENGNTVFKIEKQEFTEAMSKIAEMGVHILGGCCGTDPEFIRSLSTMLASKTPKILNNSKRTTACSATQTVEIGHIARIVGERINPTNRKKIKEALKTNNLSAIIEEAISEREAGADILDVNVGIPEIDEPLMMVQVVRAIQEVIDTPLQLDSVKVAALEAGVRIYNGKPIINSVSGKAKSMSQIFPIVKKYGTLVVALTMDEDGLPKSVQKRVEIAEKIIKTSESYGIPKENLLIDCLVLTASAQQTQVMNTLEAMRQIKAKFGVKTTLGASNVSFGLPARNIINRTYIAMALACGVDAPIVDPLSSEIQETFAAFKVLSNQDPGSTHFIDQFSNYVSPSVSRSSKNPNDNFYVSSNSVKNKTSAEESDSFSPLQEIVIKGLKNHAKEATRKMLETELPMDIVDKHLIPALDQVGNLYDKGTIFLPQLIRSAETVKVAFGLIKDQIEITQTENIEKGTIVLATVQGDLHDIGKNIVKILLENYGFNIIDLGKDVPLEKIVEIVKTQNTQLVGLSALMTTTVENMHNIIIALRKSGVNCRIMVGGAVLNPEYAKMIDADFYGRDAREAVRIAQDVF